MLEKAMILRNIAPPIQLNPKPWKAMWILRLMVASAVIVVPIAIWFLEAYAL